MGVKMRVMPGVDIGVSPRGMRADFGPTFARVSVGSDSASWSSDLGPFSIGAKLGEDPPEPRSYAAELRDLEARARGAVTAAGWEAIRNYHDRLLGVADRTFELARSPMSAVQQLLPDAGGQSEPDSGPDSAGPSRDKVATDPAQRGRGPIGRLQDAVLDLAGGVLPLPSSRSTRDQEARLAHWQALMDNDPATVMVALAKAFDASESPATAFNVEGSTAFVVLSVPAPDVFGAVEASLTEKGIRSLLPLGGVRRNERFRRMVEAQAFATARQAFAVAPGIQDVTVVVVRPDEQAAVMIVDVNRDEAGDPSRPPPPLSLRSLATEVGSLRSLGRLPGDIRDGLDDVINQITWTVQGRGV